MAQAGTLRSCDETAEADRRLAGVLDAIEEGFWDWNLSTGEFYYGRGWLVSLGYAESDLSPDESFWESLICPDDLPRFNFQLYQYLAGKRARFEVECRLRAKSGQLRWFRNHGKIVERDGHGKPVRMMGTIIDIHERKSAREELAKSQAHLSALLESTDNLIWSVDSENFGLMSCNAPFKRFAARYWGVVVAPNMVPEDFLPEDRAQAWREFYQRTLKRGSFSTDYELFSKQGALHLSFHRLIRENHVFAISIFGRDISNQKRMEEALRKSEEKFAKAFHESPMVLTLTSAIDHRYLEVNEAFEQITGCPRDEIIGRNALDVGIWVDPHERVDIVNKLRKSGSVRDIEVQLRTGSGDIRYGLKSAELIEVDEEPCILSVTTDITDRKRTEEALRDSEERLRLAIEAGRMYAFEWNLRSDRFQCSDEYCEILGVTQHDLPRTGREHIEKIHSLDRDRLAAAVKSLRRNRPSYKMSYRRLRPDNSIAWLEESGRACFDAKGDVDRVVGIAADVTEAKASELALRELSGRLINSQEEERRRVGRELHDDIGQELALLAVHAQRIDSGASEADGTTREDVHELHKRIKDVATKVSRLSHRLHSSELEFLGLAVATDHVCRDFISHYHIDMDYVIKNVPSELDQSIALCFYRVIQESLQNVAKHSRAKRVVFRLLGNSDELRLEIRDDGVGFDSERRRPEVGLGLVSMRERMHLIGGTFSIHSKPGRGVLLETRVALTLPEIAPTVLRAA